MTKKARHLLRMRRMAKARRPVRAFQLRTRALRRLFGEGLAGYKMPEWPS